MEPPQYIFDHQVLADVKLIEDDEFHALDVFRMVNGTGLEVRRSPVPCYADSPPEWQPPVHVRCTASLFDTYDICCTELLVGRICLTHPELSHR